MRGKRTCRFCGRVLRRLIVLALVAGVGCFGYQLLRADVKQPWQVVQQEQSERVNVLQQQLQQNADRSMQAADAEK